MHQVYALCANYALAFSRLSLVSLYIRDVMEISDSPVGDRDGGSQSSVARTDFHARRSTATPA
jgi:hypothetical protein